MIDVQMQLLDQLTVDRFDHLAQVVVQMPHCHRWLERLIGTWQCQQADVALNMECGCQGGTAIALVTQHRQVVVVFQQFSSNGNVSSVRWRQFEVLDDAAERAAQVEFVPEERLFLGSAFAEGGALCGPFRTGLGRMIQLDHGQWEAVDDALLIRGHVQHRENGTPQEGERVLQVASSYEWGGAERGSDAAATT